MKFNKNEFVTKDELMRMKERVNSGFSNLIRLNE